MRKEELLFKKIRSCEKYSVVREKRAYQRGFKSVFNSTA